jgi:Domain of unknown function (DUF4145)
MNTASAEPGGEVMAHCNRCAGERRHIVIAAERTTWEEEVEPGYRIDGSDDFLMLRCRGCDFVHMEHAAWYCQQTNEHGDPVPTHKQYPPKINRHPPRWTLATEWVFLFDQPVRVLYEEVNRAVAADCPRLAAMGVRALIEAVMVEKVSDRGSFSKNLDALLADGHISRNQREHLSQVIDGGSAAIHRGFSPSMDDVHALLDITENVIEALYVTPHKAQRLGERIPARTALARPAGESPDKGS